MLSHLAAAVAPVLGRLTITSDSANEPTTGTLFIANHTSLADPVVVLAALHRRNIQPIVLATAGLWRIPLLRRFLDQSGHIPVHRHTSRAAGALDEATAVLRSGRHILIYGEGRLPERRDAAESAPEGFRSGPARLARMAEAPIIPIGQAGSRRITSGGSLKQLAGVLTAPVRRPALHVHFGASLRLPGDIPSATAAAHEAVTAAWRIAAQRTGETTAPRSGRPGPTSAESGPDEMVPRPRR